MIAAFFLGHLGGKDAISRSESVMPDGRGVQVYPVEVNNDTIAIVMMDPVQQNLWVYRYSVRGGSHGKLYLEAARSYKYDRLLESYNTSPQPDYIRQILERFQVGSQGEQAVEEPVQEESGTELNTDTE